MCLLVCINKCIKKIQNINIKYLKTINNKYFSILRQDIYNHVPIVLKCNDNINIFYKLKNVLIQKM